MYIKIRFTHKGRKRLSSITLLSCEILAISKSKVISLKRLRFLKNKMSFQTRRFAFLELATNIQQKNENKLFISIFFRANARNLFFCAVRHKMLVETRIVSTNLACRRYAMCYFLAMLRTYGTLLSGKNLFWLCRFSIGCRRTLFLPTFCA